MFVSSDLGRELVRDITSQRGGSLLVTGDRLAAEVGDQPGRLDALLDDARSRVMVGTLDHVVIGFAVCHVVDDGDQARRGVLDACYVEPEARGVGVGRLLLEALLAWLEERGCDGVDGVALPGDRGAKNFYESAGFKARHDHHAPPDGLSARPQLWIRRPDGPGRYGRGPGGGGPAEVGSGSPSVGPARERIPMLCERRPRGSRRPLPAGLPV